MDALAGSRGADDGANPSPDAPVPLAPDPAGAAPPLPAPAPLSPVLEAPASPSFGEEEEEARRWGAPADGLGAGIVDVEWSIDAKDLRLVEKIGEGGMGEVWRAHWAGAMVAVKFVRAGDGPDPEAAADPGGAAASAAVPSKQRSRTVKAFCREVRLLSRLRHPNCVLFMGASVPAFAKERLAQDDRYAIVTEFMPGGSLFDRIHADGGERWVSGTKPSRLLAISRDICYGMIYLHAKGFIHRDLKSKNVLVDRSFVCKIADFGMSRIRENKRELPSSALSGSPGWMAPEIIRAHNYDEKVDVYSFGIVLFELCSGEVPYQKLYGTEANPVRIVFDVVQGKRPALPDFIAGELGDLIEACWQQDSAARPSFEAVLSRLLAPDAEQMFVNERNEMLQGVPERLNSDEPVISADQSAAAPAPAAKPPKAKWKAPFRALKRAFGRSAAK